MKEKLLYLSKYSKNIEIIKYSQISENERKILPDYWNKAFINNNLNDHRLKAVGFFSG